MLQSRAIFRSDSRNGYEEGKSLEKNAFVNLENLRWGACFFTTYFGNISTTICAFSAPCVSLRNKRSMTLFERNFWSDEKMREGGI